MKSNVSKGSLGSLLKQETELPVRVIKAAQAGKSLNGGLDIGHASNGAGKAHKKAEIRMIHVGADYCDLEVICGCGEVTQVRCWNTPAAA
jgi:hypothetical protein